MNTPAPLSILIGALGGEGGGVLAGWLTRTAELCGYPVQRTSIPGVAQRTGATTYYVEIVPAAREQLGGEPVLALSPVPGRIDLMVVSELLEAGRAIQNGLASPERTTLIASNHRIFTVVEKAAMGDGRYDREHLQRAVERFAKRAILFDMEAAARASGTAVSAVMLGAIAASGLVPAPRAMFEDAIRESGTGVEASLKGFAAGFAAAAPPESNPAAAARPRRIETTAAADDEPLAKLHALIERGYTRQLDYQDHDYAELYRERVAAVEAAERARGAGDGLPITTACARFLALWMSYEDVIRVADLKSRRSRLQRLAEEVGAKPGEIVRVVEYLKPGLDEWCAILPRAAAARLRRWAHARGWGLSVGLHVHTTSLHGFVLLRLLASLRRWRRYTSRFAEEQALIERWLGAISQTLKHDASLALEIALCGRLIKGYGDTHARGKGSFIAILDTLSQPMADSGTSRAAAVRAAREAALTDPEGDRLEQSLSAHGWHYARPAPGPAPIVWHKSARPTSRQR